MSLLSSDLFIKSLFRFLKFLLRTGRDAFLLAASRKDVISEFFVGSGTPTVSRAHFIQ